MYVIAKKFYYDWAFYIFLSCVNLLFSRSPFLKLQTFDDGYDFWWWRGNTYILLKNMCVIHLKLNHICIKAKKEWLTKHKVFLFFSTQSLFVSFWTENGSELVASLSAVIANVDWQRLGGNPFWEIAYWPSRHVIKIELKGGMHHLFGFDMEWEVYGQPKWQIVVSILSLPIQHLFICYNNWPKLCQHKMVPLGLWQKCLWQERKRGELTIGIEPLRICLAL